jgi:hypothetical protein
LKDWIFPNHWCHADEVVNNSNRYGGILSPEVINNWFAAAASNSSTGSGISGSALDDKTKHSLYNYILDNIPVVLKNDVFKAVSRDILDEMSAAYNHWCHADEVVNNSNRYGGILSPEVINNWFATFDTPLQ